MDSPLTAYIAITCVSGVLNLLLGFYVIMKRELDRKIAVIFVWGTAAKAIYSFSYAFSLTSSTLEQLRFWSVMQYFGMPFAPPLGLLFVLQYLGIRVRKRTVIALLTMPVISLISNATNEWHHLHYKVYKIHESLGAPYYDIEVGITYILNGSFMFVCMVASTYLLLSRWKDTAKEYRPQLFALVCAILIPMTVSFLYLMGVTPTGIDPVPMVVGFSSILFWWAIVTSHLLSVVPIAKDTIFHSIGDGVIVLDKSGRMVEFNDGAGHMFRVLDRTMHGMPVQQVWSRLFRIAPELAPAKAVGSHELEVTLSGQENRFYQVRFSPLKRTSRSSIAGTVMIITDITQVKQLQHELERRAYYDELTQILNRRAFFERCETEYAWAKQTGDPFTIILFDIDYFKQVNDTYGHKAGDLSLIHVAQECRSCMKDNILFARYGGEEFVIALSGRSAAEGQAFAEQLRQRIESQPLVVDGKNIRITSSFGVAESSGSAEESFSHLLHLADQALYAAKRSGRNQVQVFAG
jgi:diguanylate cyclase (GGDEF)-like protein